LQDIQSSGIHPKPEQLINCKVTNAQDDRRAIRQQWQRFLHREKQAFHIDVKD